MVSVMGAPDTFSDNHATPGATGPSKYLWSDAANWSDGVPTNGESVVVGGTGTDDIQGLNLPSVTVLAGGVLYNVADLSIGSLSVGDNATVVDDAEGGTPSKLTIASILGDGTGNAEGATGAVVAALGGGAVVELTGNDPGLYYAATDRGVVWLDGAPSANSAFAFLDPARPGVFAFSNPGTVVQAQLLGFGTGDAVELPGTFFSAVHIGPSSVTIVSNAGTVAFTDVSYATSLTGEAIAKDPSTNLDAVTFLGYTTFEQTDPTGGPFLWSEGRNWTNGAPQDGDGVVIGAAGVDDITDLHLVGLTAENGTALTVKGDLVATAMQLAGGATIAISATAGDPHGLLTGQLSGGGALTIDGAGASAEIGIDGGANYTLRNGGALALESTVAIGSDIAFADSARDILALAAPGATIEAGLAGLSPGDILELPGTNVVGVTIGNSTLTIVTNIGTYNFDDVAYGTRPSGYTPGIDEVRGLATVEFTPACFAAGSRILTPEGEVPVEELRSGDLVITAEGSARAIRWAGRRRMYFRLQPAPARSLPIRVQAGTFGPGLPQRDLFLSPDHAIYSDGVLIPIRHLVNGLDIVPVETETVLYCHVELETHDVLLAEGMPAESFLDTGARNAFANGGISAELHRDFAAPEEPLVWEAMACAPLKVTGAEVARLRQIIAGRDCAKAAAAFHRPDGNRYGWRGPVAGRYA
jgi:collagen type I alpha